MCCYLESRVFKPLERKNKFKTLPFQCFFISLLVIDPLKNTNLLKQNLKISAKICENGCIKTILKIFPNSFTLVYNDDHQVRLWITHTLTTAIKKCTSQIYSAQISSRVAPALGFLKRKIVLVLIFLFNYSIYNPCRRNVLAHFSSVLSWSSTLRVSGSSKHKPPATMGRNPYITMGMV